MSREGHRLSVGQEHEILEKLRSAGLTPKEAQAIITAPGNELAERIAEMASEYSNDTLGQYQRLFDQQLERLFKVGFAPEIISMLQYQKEEVLKTASDFTGSWGYTSFWFVPVIPREYSSAHDQFTRIKLDPTPTQRIIKSKINLSVVEYLEPIFDKGETAPPWPYYIFDIAFGSADETAGKTVAECRELFAANGRKGLTDTELAALVLHRNWPLPGMYASNTAYRGGKTDYSYAVHISVSNLRNGVDNLQITGHSTNCEHEEYIVPSCAYRLQPKIPENLGKGFENNS